MPGPIIAVANQKGGVGKTTTSINLAAGLAQRGLKTLLVDLDPQGNATLSFVQADVVTRSIYDLLVDPTIQLADVIVPALENLDIVGARISLAKAEAKLIGEFDSHYRLKDKLTPAREQYDFVVIDTPPTLGILTVNALVAATHLLVPIQSSYYAIEGTDDLLDTYQKIRARPNPDLEFLGVVVTIHDKRTLLAKDIHKQIRTVFGEKVFRTTISKSVRLEESPAYRQSIFTFAPGSSGALEYYGLTEEVIQRV